MSHLTANVNKQNTLHNSSRVRSINAKQRNSETAQQQTKKREEGRERAADAHSIVIDETESRLVGTCGSEQKLTEMSIGERTSPKAGNSDAATSAAGDAAAAKVASVDGQCDSRLSSHHHQQQQQQHSLKSSIAGDGATIPVPLSISVSSTTDKENGKINLTDPNMDLLTMAQREELERRIIQANPELVNSQTESILSLRFEFANDTRYLHKVDRLAAKYDRLRRVRPDGNCFFRSLAFSYCQRLIEPSMRAEWLRFRRVVTDMRNKMIDELKFPEFTVQDFYESFMDFLDKCHPPPSLSESSTEPDSSCAPSSTEEDTVTTSSAADCMSPEELMSLFNDQATSDYFVVFLRLITSAYMQLNADFYACFIEDGVSVAQFCARHVEPMYQESDHVHISALTQATGIAVQIMYLDRGDQHEASAIRFPEDAQPLVHLLYRPGHYEIIYPIGCHVGDGGVGDKSGVSFGIDGDSDNSNTVESTTD